MWACACVCVCVCEWASVCVCERVYVYVCVFEGIQWELTVQTEYGAAAVSYSGNIESIVSTNTSTVIAWEL